MIYICEKFTPESVILRTVKLSFAKLLEKGILAVFLPCVW